MKDFRSDTVTRPCDAMRQCMASAEVGDDVYGDDPEVNRLEAYAAELTGFKQALFTSSGTQANLLALMSHCQRGDEYICGQGAHNYKYEAGGAAVLGGIQPQPLTNQADGSLALADIEAAIKPDDFHFACTRLVSLENTISGQVLSQDYVNQVAQLCNQRGLALHLDGARVFNAVVASGVDINAMCEPFDSVSICLSKGLGAPVGSLILGDDIFIAKARRLRKMLGGGMRQAGMLAAAGRFALQHNVQRLAGDHALAEYAFAQLNALSDERVIPVKQCTNMVFVDLHKLNWHALETHLKQHGILVSLGANTRLVMHKDVNQEDVDLLISVLASFLKSH